MKKILLSVFAVLCIYVNQSFADFQDDKAKNALAEYVAKPDDSYGYKIKKITKRNDGVSYAEIVMTSQTWHEPWKHQLLIIIPSTIRQNANHALLLVSGGRWNKSFEDSNYVSKKLENNLWLYINLANKIGTPIAVVSQVPYQPMWGMKEDSLIAHTFSKYIETGDTNWPLLLPMVKSAVRAMDTVQDFAKKEWSLDIKTFTVTGASKRGWTTWLTGAVDKRAAAIAPMVIDILNMGRQMERQQEVLGKGNFSENISEYTKRGMQLQTETPIGKSLLTIVDPYSYRENLTQTKVVILGTNDRYWTLDALNYYWNDLLGKKYILYVPNRGHKLSEYLKVMGTINAVHQNAAFGTALPNLTWHNDTVKGKLSYTLKSDIEPLAVRAWFAESPIKDFRDASWNSANLKQRKGRYNFKIKTPTDKCVAVFIEAEYEANMNYYFTTNIQIIGPKHCNPVSN